MKAAILKFYSAGVDKQKTADVIVEMKRIDIVRLKKFSKDQRHELNKWLIEVDRTFDRFKRSIRNKVKIDLPILHPGEVLKDELKARKIPQKEFAQCIKMRDSHLSELLSGKRHVSTKTAFKLEEQLGIDAKFWLRLQMEYDLQLFIKGN